MTEERKEIQFTQLSRMTGKRNNLRNLPFLLLMIAIALVSLVFSGCATISKEYTSHHPKGASRLTVKQDEDGTVWGEFVHPLIPCATITGDIESSENDTLFYVTKVRFFTNWPNGWTEGIYEASGSYLLKNGDGATLTQNGEFTLWSILEGEIRYFDTYYRGEEGLRKVKNRIDRMTEISRYLEEEKDFPPFYERLKGPPIKTNTGVGSQQEQPSADRTGEDRPGKRDRELRSFAGDIVPYLFPEAKGLLTCKERKDYFREENELFVSSKGEKVLGAGIFWNSGYSQKILPEEYVPLRDSGTLWRDYEEAARLFYTIYNLQYVMNEYITETNYLRSR